MTPPILFAVAMLATLAAGVLLTLVFSGSHRRATPFAVIMVLASFGLAIALAVKVSEVGGITRASFASMPAFKSTLTLHVDALTLVMLLTMMFVASWLVVFASRYNPSLRTRSVGRFYAAFLLMLLSASVVLMAGDLLVFFAAWELMSLPAFLLIVHEDRRTKNLRAGMSYLILNGVGGMAMLTGVLLIYPHTNSFSFEDTRQALSVLMHTSPWLANGIIALLLLPFGTKAGLFPTGDWAPEAYSAASCPASGLLSGVISKLGPYGAIRLFFWVVPLGSIPPPWLEVWGMALATWGAASIILGSSAAVVSDDGKRLLAYSSVSQSGYIFLGIGVAVAALSVSPVISAVALVAVGVHVVVDAMHKSALFMVSGSITFRTGTDDINKLGGLESRMPVTTVTALAGAASLAGLPLSGAFVSKWLLIQSALWLGRTHALFLVYVVVALVGSVLAVAYGLKYVGAIFLGPQSTLVAEVTGGEVPRRMRVPQKALVICSFVIGILPAFFIDSIMQALPPSLAGAGAQAFGELSFARLLPLAGATPTAAFSPLWVLGMLLVGVGGAWLWSRMGDAAVRETEPWACGEFFIPDDVRPRGGGYFWALSRYLSRVYTQIGLPTFAGPEQRWQTLESDRWAFDRVSAYCWMIAHRMARLQSGLTQRYVLWQVLGAGLITLIVLYSSR